MEVNQKVAGLNDIDAREIITLLPYGPALYSG